MPLNREQRVALFWSKVEKTEGCWLWKGPPRNKCGYGQFFDGAKNRAAHRVAWEYTKGAIPEGLLVLHRCDNPPCVNPEHLFLGTNDDNVADREAKGRGAKGARCVAKTLHRGADHPMNRRPELRPRGERHGCARLTEAQAREIRALMLAKTETVSAIARRFGVSRAHARRIAQGRNWSGTT